MITSPDDLTAAVLAEVERAQDPRTKELLAAGVKHLHAFVRETRLTEADFQRIARIIAKLGQLSNKSHNEVVLIAGSLGVSALVCLQNNGEGGERETTANLMGPFWRAGAPEERNGASIVRSTTPGDPMFVHRHRGRPGGEAGRGRGGRRLAYVERGHLRKPGPSQADFNLRGRFMTDENGQISFRSVEPAGYPIPINGPVGDLLRAQGRHNMRPAHIHFLVDKPGHKSQFSQVYSSDDPHLETDVQFGVTRALVGKYVKHETASEPAPDPTVGGTWYSLDHKLIIEPRERSPPEPPITGKATGEPPVAQVLARRRDLPTVRNTFVVIETTAAPAAIPVRN
jgi:hydroxyquinol 1,2-dioxygenase